MTATPDDAADRTETYRRLLNAVHRLDLISRRDADRTLLEELGIGRAQFLVLDLIAEPSRTQLNQQAIADELGLSRAAVSRQVIEAARRGWVTAEPSAGSQRDNVVALTAEGDQLARAGRRQRTAAAQRALGRVDLEDARTAVAVLEALASR